MKVTIHDVAKYAGVSIKTVSRVTNNEPSVKQATVDKVNEAIRALNYQPNQSARSLAGTKSYVIGFVYDNPNAYYVIDMQNGILSACREQGYELLIHPCDAAQEGICDKLVALVNQARLAGLVLTPPLSEDPAVLNALDAIDVNYVRIIAGAEADGQSGLSVLVDDRTGAVNITEHLLALGHTRIAFLTGEMSHQSTLERLAGYQQAMSARGVQIPEHYIVEGKYSFESGVNGAKQLLALEQRPTAIVACNDEIAAGVLVAARLDGVEVPTQLSIVGFEDSPFSRQTWPKLTTVHQPNSEIARVATQVLIATRQQQKAPKSTVFVPEAIIRESSDKVPPINKI
ncbi:LacI family DNA-binding transcriptional regulator [Shewanella sp. GXUN23E]|uniref:LacI family DNA-binding transcriptional regulator n=1 Tax=Shewanella sp. GXUN23E TaxID=3422498 RepID=UPI003D7DE623